LFDHIKPLIGSLASFAKQRMGFHHPPKLFLKQDTNNSNKALGKTAYYDPQEQSVTLYITARHPKDILRSLSHELVHHTQNLRGDLSAEKMGQMSKSYAQDNDHMRNMEKEAYLQGNMCFRDWEDTIKDKDLILIKIAESKFLKENKTMTTKITKEFLEETIRKILEQKMPATDIDVQDLSRGRRLDQAKAQEAVAIEIFGTKEKAQAAASRYGSIDKAIAAARADSSIVASLEENEELEEKNWKDTTGDDKFTQADLLKARGVELSEEKTSMVDAEKALYEERFGNRNNKLFEHLVKNWTK
jgi:hypothetical protein